ncbi:DUF1653 domain-containing protein [Shouchella clausii]|uniref:DUF1653 domain-containing protein n=1 Tax=Shouchella clausii TaxID=79880 RepID=UPI001C738FAA|nr:DUF1653 domain-containing protein [Shouchella clausii]MBX0320262.1 DUF1653 domain-containing protein [Shouchella clausii]MEB5480721.1 DUF1653 domain-containing protein [Shouchella clausii]
MIYRHYKGGLYYTFEMYTTSGLILLWGLEKLEIEEECTFTHTETGREIKAFVTQIKGFATHRVLHNEEEESLVYYKDLKGNMWARPAEMFEGKVEVEGRQVDRFKSLGEYEVFEEIMKLRN